MSKVYILQYDIPQPNGRPVCDNPSGALYGCGAVRTTGSVWIVTEEDLNRQRMMRVLDFFTRHGVTWYTAAFDISEAKTLRRMALDNLRREVAGYKARAEESRAAADERFEDESDTNYKARRRALLTAARHLELNVANVLRRIAYAASRFDISEAEIGAVSAANDLEVIVHNWKERAAAFARTHGILTRSRKAREDGILGSFLSDEIPVLVVADYIEETEGEEGAEAAGEIRSSFGLI